MTLDQAAVSAAAALLEDADGLLVCAGAGMGADSGLPTFRDQGGFWDAYPALGRARIDFTDIANPAAFKATPTLAWGFYGHRLSLYRATPPHDGFRILLDLAARTEHGPFVFTSNVDGLFQAAGFPEERVCEIHGSIRFLQCGDDCQGRIWPADDMRPKVGADECLLISPLPSCPDCAAVARPNILMFDDFGWNRTRSAAQHDRLDTWLAVVRRPAVVEVGAGTSIPTVRGFGYRFADRLIRINPDAAAIHGGKGVSLRARGLEALRAIERASRRS